MAHEASAGSRAAEAEVLGGPGALPGGGSLWQTLERRVLLSKLREFEERARQLEGLERHLRGLGQEVELLTRLSRSAHTIHRAAAARELFEVALREYVALLRADKGSLLLHEPRANELVVAKVHGVCPVPLEGVRLPVGQGVAGYVALHRAPLRVEDIAQDGRFAMRDSARYATGSFLCVPVQAGDCLLGVLNAADRGDRRPFSAMDLRAAVSLAAELAVALGRVHQAEALQASQRQLMSKLAHELRNPLDGALRFINLSLADSSPEERRRRYLLATKQGLERLSGIVEGMVGLNDLMAQAVALQEGKAQQRGVRIEMNLAEGLPLVAGGSGLFQVFTNLVSNALDAMEAGGGMLTVSSRRVDGAVVARVADTGPGMPPQVLERLFTPFFTTKPPGRGMGLGLAVCREVIDRLRGRIEVTSKPGHGTVFSVVVPCGMIE